MKKEDIIIGYLLNKKIYFVYKKKDLTKIIKYKMENKSQEILITDSYKITKILYDIFWEEKYEMCYIYSIIKL